MLNSEGLKPNVRFRVRGDEAIQSMIAKGLGVSIAPELVLSRRPEGIVLRPFEPEYHRVLGLALPENGGWGLASGYAACSAASAFFMRSFFAFALSFIRILRPFLISAPCDILQHNPRFFQILLSAAGSLLFAVAFYEIHK